MTRIYQLLYTARVVRGHLERRRRAYPEMYRHKMLRFNEDMQNTCAIALASPRKTLRARDLRFEQLAKERCFTSAQDM